MTELITKVTERIVVVHMVPRTFKLGIQCLLLLLIEGRLVVAVENKVESGYKLIIPLNLNWFILNAAGSNVPTFFVDRLTKIVQIWVKGAPAFGGFEFDDCLNDNDHCAHNQCVDIVATILVP